MFCRNCGNEVQEDAIGCMKCGCDPYDGENFCPACGASINEKQVVCTQCGMTLRDSDWDSDRNSNNSNMNSKKGMFCRNCGNEVSVDAVACMKCGCSPHEGKSFCPSCGAKTSEKQIVCIKCGIDLRKDDDWDSNRNSNNSYKKPGSKHKVTKDRISAALLAIFLGEIGGHQLYLGNSASAAVRMIVLCISIFLLNYGYDQHSSFSSNLGSILIVLSQIVAFIEAIIYFCKTDEEFDEIYVQNKRSWF